MNKKEVENLISKLSDKTLSFGCRLRWIDCGEATIVMVRDIDEIKYEVMFDAPKSSASFDYLDRFEVLGHQILLGDVLAKTKYDEEIIKIVRLWRPLGLDSSLQEIVQESGFKGERFKLPPNGLESDEWGESVRLKDPKAEALLSFINNLIS